MNKVHIEVNDSTKAHNGNVSIEFESEDMEVDKLEDLAVKTIEKVKKK